MYTVSKLYPDTFRILDETEEALYLILRSRYALLIDTGMGKSSLSSCVRTLTDLPVKAVLTHGHIDHIGRSGEFKDVAMNPLDTELFLEHARLASQQKLVPASSLPLPLEKEYDGIVPVLLSGHTPGSTIFADLKNHAVYTGDALGSGCGVWMQIKGALTIGEYENGIRNARLRLRELGCTNAWRFYGGHARQEYQSAVSSYNPLSMTLMEDMEALCAGLLRHECKLQETDVPSDGIPYYASWRTAEILTTKDRIR